MDQKRLGPDAPFVGVTTAGTSSYDAGGGGRGSMLRPIEGGGRSGLESVVRGLQQQQGGGGGVMMVAGGLVDLDSGRMRAPLDAGNSSHTHHVLLRHHQEFADI